MTAPSFLTFDERPKVRDFAKLVLVYISQHPGVPRATINLEFKTSSNIATNALLSCIIRNLLVHKNIVRQTTGLSVLFWATGAPGAPPPEISTFLSNQAEADYQNLLPKKKPVPKEASIEKASERPTVEQKESLEKTNSDVADDNIVEDNSTPSAHLSNEDRSVLENSLTGLYKKVFDVISENPPTTLWTSEGLRKCLTHPQPRVNTVGATLGRLWSFGLLRKFEDANGALYYRVAKGKLALPDTLHEVLYVGPASKSAKGQAKETKRLLLEKARQQDLDSQLDDVILDTVTKFPTLTTTGDTVTAASNWASSPVATINSNNILSLVRDDGSSITFSETESLAIKSLFR
jgi:hypothetical protein